MDAANVMEVCRLCPSSGGSHDLLNVFDRSISFKYNIREVILTYTGIEILETDPVSKKICQRCCNILYKMYEFRLDALKQDRTLKDKCGHYDDVMGTRLPPINTSITIKKENAVLTNKKIKTEPNIRQPSTSLNPSTSSTPSVPSTPLTSSTFPTSSIPSTSLTPVTSFNSSGSREDLRKRLHPSVADVFRNYPNFKLPKKCFERHMAPVVSLTMDEVERYFKKKKLDMRKFIYKPITKILASPKVARKRTAVSAKPKTVAPLKISRKPLENGENSKTSTDNSYICSSVPKEEKVRKRKISSGEDKNLSVESKLAKNIQPKPLTAPKSNPDMPKSTNNKVNDRVKVNKMASTPNCSSIVDKPGSSRSEKTSSPAHVDPVFKKSRSPSPAPAEPFSEDSRDSCLTDISEATAGSSSDKPEFMDSFGLTPTVTTTKSHTLLVCSLCGSVHHNSFELKRHTSKHMVCQFCKIRFKSIESKQKHVDHSCPIKKVMNSSGPIVKLEKIHLNLNVRKKYRTAFTSFELIPGLETTPLEQVIIRETSPPLSNIEDAVIVLSDDEDETTARSPDPLSSISTSSTMTSPAAENFVYSTVSIVRPDIRIKHNTVINSLVENMTDKQLLKDLIELFRPPQPTTIEAMIQTDLPANRDIQINDLEGTCEFKNLKGQLATYKIPVTISNGPHNITYQFKNISKTNKQMAVWDNLPVIGLTKKSESASGLRNSPLTQNTSSSSLIIGTSKDQSLDVTASSVPVISQSTTNAVVLLPNTFGPTPTVSTVNGNCSGLVTAQASFNQSLQGGHLAFPISTNTIPINTSNSATPLLQNYALSMTTAPLNNNPIPIPRTYINSALNKTVSNSSRPIGHNFIPRPYPSSVTTTNNRSLLSSNLAAGTKPGNILVLNRLPPSNTSSCPTVVPLNNSLSTTVTVANTNNPSICTPAVTPIVPEVSKFRVKSVWELQ